MRYYDSLGQAGYPISQPCSTMPCSFDEHLARGSRGGVDFAVRTGTPVIAPTKGRVRNWANASAGNAVDFYHIDDNGNETGFYDQFMHLSAFVSPGVYGPGATIGFSGNTGSSTGPHIHWNLVNPQGRVVRQWEYFREDPPKPDKAQEVARLEMIYIFCQENNITYLIGQQYIAWPFGKDASNLAKSFGDFKQYAKLADVIAVAKAFGVPEDKVRNVPASRYWSKLDTIQPGGGATPAEIAAAVDASLKDDFAGIPKTVNDDVAKRMSS